MAPVRPERRPLGPQVVDAVLALIDERGFAPGDRLPSEAALAEQFGVSRPVVREALSTLSERGVVEVVNGRGAMLAALDSRPLSTFFERAIAERAEAMSELMEVRRGIELEAVALAARRARPEQIAALRATAAAMRGALASDAYVPLDVRFHLELAEATGNGLIVHLMRSIRPMLERSVDDGFRSRTEPGPQRARARAPRGARGRTGTRRRGRRHGRDDRPLRRRRRVAQAGGWLGTVTRVGRSRAHSAEGTAAPSTRTSASTSAAERAPTSTSATAGWPSGNCSAAAASRRRTRGTRRRSPGAREDVRRRRLVLVGAPGRGSARMPLLRTPQRPRATPRPRTGPADRAAPGSCSSSV